MKTVYLIRHAKSSWDDEDLADFSEGFRTRIKVTNGRATVVTWNYLTRHTDE